MTYNKNNKSNKKEIDMNFIYNCWKYPGEPHTLNDVGNAFNLTRERIRPIMNKALRKLKVSVKKKILVK